MDMGPTGMEKKSMLRDLVGDLIKDNPKFGKKKIGSTEMDVIDAIEANEVTFYLHTNPGDDFIDAIHCLHAIHGELEKNNPDEDFIERTIEQLKEYL